MHTLELKIPPLVLGLLVAALMWLVSSAAPSFGFKIPGNVLVAAGLALVGAATSTSGVVSFRRARTTVDPTKPVAASSLVVSGIYSFTRNPMYLGFLFALTGWAVFLSNALALALLPAFVAYITRFQIVPEERALSSLFGHEFSAYEARVRRWV